MVQKIIDLDIHVAYNLRGHSRLGLNTSLLNFTIGFCVRIDTFHYGLMGELRKKKGELEKVPMTGS